MWNYITNKRHPKYHADPKIIFIICLIHTYTNFCADS